MVLRFVIQNMISLFRLPTQSYLLTVIGLLKKCGISVTYESIAAKRRLLAIKGELS